MSLFAERIKKIRKNFAWTQEEFSNEIGVSIDTIQKWEKGTLTPRLDVAENLAQQLKISLNYLIGASEKENEDNVSGNMLIFKNGNQEIKIPDTEENKKLFLTIVGKMVASCNAQAKINMQDNISGNNNVEM